MPTDNNVFLGYSMDLPLRVEPKSSAAFGIVLGKLDSYFTPTVTALLRPLASSVSLSCVSCGVPGIHKMEILSRDEWLSSLRRARFLLGVGDPIGSPSVLEALTLGCMVILPRQRPNRVIMGRRHRSQYDDLSKVVPDTSRICYYDTPQDLHACVSRALSRPVPPRVLPLFTHSAFTQRVKTWLKMDPWKSHPVLDATHTQSQATTWVVFTHPTKAPDVRKSNVKALRKHMPFVTPFPTNWGFDASCRETLRQEHVSVHEHYAGGSLGGYIEAGKLGQWCTVLRFLRHCAETHGRVCVSIEDDVVVSPDEVFNLTQVVQTLTFDTAMVRLGPKSCTDCIVAYDPTTCLELVQLVQRHTIDNPTDLLFGWYKHYTRGPYFGHLLDPSNSPKTSLVRSLGMLSIRSVNKNIQ